MIAEASSSLLKELTRHKLDAAIKAIELTASKEHPFPDCIEALEGIRRHIEDLLNRVLRPNQSDLLVKNACRVAIEQLVEVTPLIGFIERSTNVAGPVELYGPFARLVKTMVGEDTRLILSSMWNFSPYTITYPDEVPKHVADFVYVSFSVAEADNSFLSPLAAHELGHNIWCQKRLKPTIKPLVGKEVVRLLETEFKGRLFATVGHMHAVDDLFGQVSWQPAHFWAMKQLEETFCDFVGLYLFGPSYIYAFAHYIGPGLNASESTYPQAHERFTTLLKFAKVEGWAVDDSFSTGLFDVSTRPRSVSSSLASETLLEVADRAREGLVDEIASIARQCVAEKEMLFDPTSLEQLEKQLSRGIPCSGASSLSMIVNAGWNVFICRYYKSTADSNWGLSLDETPRVLNEILLKSFEIYEVETRLNGDVACSMQPALENWSAMSPAA